MEIFSLIAINVPCICRKDPIHLRFNKKCFIPEKKFTNGTRVNASRCVNNVKKKRKFFSEENLQSSFVYLKPSNIYTSMYNFEKKKKFSEKKIRQSPFIHRPERFDV